MYRFTLYCSLILLSSIDAFLPPLKLLSQATTLLQGEKTALSSSLKQNFEYALLFDCDGVILETEELHRLAYNQAFREYALTINNQPVEWSVEYYDLLQNTIGGGKPKMFFHFRNTTGVFPNIGTEPPPATSEQQQALVDQLQTYKTKVYKELLETAAKPRPGVLKLMDQALADERIGVGVCSASTKESALKTLDITLGGDRVSKLDVCILGDDVPLKKPDPLIYNLARQRLGIDDPLKCVVIEDSLIGLQAAKAAGMRCIITYTSSTAECDFYGNGADAKMSDLESRNVRLDMIFNPLRQNGLNAELLVNVKDPTNAKVMYRE